MTTACYGFTIAEFSSSSIRACFSLKRCHSGCSQLTGKSSREPWTLDQIMAEARLVRLYIAPSDHLRLVGYDATLSVMDKADLPYWMISVGKKWNIIAPRWYTSASTWVTINLTWKSPKFLRFQKHPLGGGMCRLGCPTRHRQDRFSQWAAHNNVCAWH